MAIIAPTAEADIAAIVTDYYNKGDKLHIRGGGTRLPYFADDYPTLTTKALTGIVTYEPGELTLIAKAGTPVEEIEQLLLSEGQALAFEPMDHRHILGSNGTPTIGGVVGGNISGPRRVHGGACRDYLLGVRFIDGKGRIIKSGGRVMKNVTGMDLGKLLCGSYGTLGVLSEVAFKVLPLMERQASLAFHGISPNEAVMILAKALATPFEVSGAAYYNGTAWMRIEGLSKQVDYRCKQLLALFSKYDIEIIEDRDSQKLWRNLKNVQHFAQSPNALWRIFTKASDAPHLIHALLPLGGDISFDWGGALIWYLTNATAAQIRQAVPLGSATLIGRGAANNEKPADLKADMFPSQASGFEHIATKLRATFDPANIFNPGLMGG